ncbi:Tetratricopeptide-like helical [Ostreococcus tauri]|uniref:Tetratricopeptide-like helical n=1 Tax=Ostreococcus tauri TaxID=70448 RepID=A0A096PB11_OSTTA|nr:Tetratricopeptide-like helical [Ostreococcus tauri]CEG02204.1 Tetratricopeptide-like helical [Ostreococcus tauri]|eukprot:XP_022841406.1 Tetratricopeptide-like helical [Ostreococcus tauri]
MWAKIAASGDRNGVTENVVRDAGTRVREGAVSAAHEAKPMAERGRQTRDAGRTSTQGRQAMSARGYNASDAMNSHAHGGAKTGADDRERRDRGGAVDLDSLIALIEQVDPSEVERVLRESVFKPGPPAYTSVIKACGKIGMWQKALEAYRLMTILHRAKPNTITCSALINALGRSRQCDKAFEIFDEMKQRGIPANIFTYSALLSTCAKAKQYQRAMDVFNDLVENHQEIEVDRITYSAAISCCVQGRRADKAIEIFNRMTAAGIRGNTITFNTVLNACEKSGDAEQAVATFERMLEEKVSVDKTSFHALIGALDRARDLPRAIEYYRMMKSMSVRPDATTVSNMLNACANAKDPVAAIKIYKEAQAKYDIAATPGMFNALITALHKGKRHDLVYEQLYDSMSQSALSVSTYVHLMMACERFQNWAKSFEIFEEFKKHSPTSVDPFMWTRVFLSCGRFDSDDPVWKNGCIPGYTSPTLEHARATLRGLWSEYKFKLRNIKGWGAGTRVFDAETPVQNGDEGIRFGTVPSNTDLAGKEVHSDAPDQDFFQMINAYRSAAAAAARCSDPNTVLDILNFCEETSVPSDSILLGAYVAALALNGDRIGANEKFREMFALGHQPGIAVYAALARAAARAGDANTALHLAEEVGHLVGNSSGDRDMIEAVVAACEAGGDWGRGANLFAIWAKNGVEGADGELRRAAAACSGQDPGPTRRGSTYFRARPSTPAHKPTALTAQVEPFVPTRRVSQNRSRTQSMSDEGGTAAMTPEA